MHELVLHSWRCFGMCISDYHGGVLDLLDIMFL